MAGRQGHLVYVPGVPGAHEHAAGVRIVLDEVDDLLQLVYAAAVGCFPAAPLVAVDRAQVTVFIGPLIPDGDLVVVQVADVRISGDEPEKLVYDGAEMYFLGGEKGETLAEVEAHLVAEHALRAHSGAVLLDYSVLAYVAQQVEVLFHRLSRYERTFSVGASFITTRLEASRRYSEGIARMS